jgi:hypothetical protein
MDRLFKTISKVTLSKTGSVPWLGGSLPDRIRNQPTCSRGKVTDIVLSGLESPLDVGGAGPFIVALFGGGLCPSVDVFRLIW